MIGWRCSDRARSNRWEPRGELYENPLNMFVAGFIGSPPMNFVPASVDGSTLNLPFTSFELAADMREAVGDRDIVMVGIRPERFEDHSLMDAAKSDQGESFEAKVDVIEWLGNEQYAYIPYETADSMVSSLDALERDLDSERMRTQLVVALDPNSEIGDGSTATIWFDPRSMHIFDPGSGENLTHQESKVPAST